MRIIILRNCIVWIYGHNTVILTCVFILFHVVKDIFFGIFVLETVMEFLEKLSDKLSERFVFFSFFYCAF